MRIIIWILLIYLAYRMLRGRPSPQIKKESSSTEFFQDPVCGVYVSEADAVVGTMAGERYHFCSMDCLRRFEKSQQQG